MEDVEAQKDEVLALQSIFDESQVLINSTSNHHTGCIFVKPELEDNFTVLGDETELKIQHLCPLELHFILPSEYPSTKPPHFTLVCKWLTRDQLSKLCTAMDTQWEEELKGQVVLFEWLQFLQYEALDFLEFKGGLNLSWFYTSDVNTSRRSSITEKQPNQSLTNTTPLNTTLDTRAVQDSQYNGDLLEFLKSYDRQETLKEFEKSSQSCKVCFDEKMGSQCMQFPNCSHVYCKECMKSYFEIQIRDGTVNSLGCPEDKCTSQASPVQVKELVSPDLFSRYDTLLLESTIASMLNTTYCPRPKCQYPVSFENDSTMGSCPLCSFHFCLLCKATYHGVAPCKMTSGEMMTMYQAYINASDLEKTAMERRYGKKQLETLVDDIQTASWMGKNSKQCPHCKAHIEKEDGCNKMACLRCGTYFCWLCQSVLDKKFPYLHFNRPTARCRLFEGVVEEEDHDEWVNMVFDDSDEDPL